MGQRAHFVAGEAHHRPAFARVMQRLRVFHVGGGEHLRLAPPAISFLSGPEGPYFASTLLPVLASYALATSVSAAFRLPAA